MITKETQAKIDHCIEQGAAIKLQFPLVDRVEFKLYNIPKEDVLAIDSIPQWWPDGSVMGLTTWDISGDDNIWLYSGGEQV